MTTQPGFVPERQALRRALDRAAPTFDSAAYLHREVAERLFARLDYLKIAPRRVLDSGCRTGHGTQALANRYRAADVIAVDASENMLRRMYEKTSWWNRHLPWRAGALPRLICAEMDALPLAANSLGLVWSNLALHWYDLARSVAEMHRVLEVGGVFMFSTLGPDTLKELREACAGLDRHAHVNRFIDMHDIGDALVHAGFSDPVMDMEIITVTFADVAALARDLKSSGSRNYLPGRARALLAPRRWREVTQRYEAMRKDGRLPATMEVIYGHAWKPAPKATADGRQIVQFRDYPRGEGVR